MDKHVQFVIAILNILGKIVLACLESKTRGKQYHLIGYQVAPFHIKKTTWNVCSICSRDKPSKTWIVSHSNARDVYLCVVEQECHKKL